MQVPKRKEWDLPVIEAAGKFEYIAQLLDDQGEAVLPFVRKSFREPSLCNLCRAAGIDENGNPRCDKCVVTGWGEKLDFSCTADMRLHFTGKTQADRTRMHAFLEAVVAGDVKKAARLARQVAQTLRLIYLYPTHVPDYEELARARTGD